MAGYDIRQDKSYRRGLILGLTMAEVMILLIFVLLMALASALANRDKRLKALEDGTGSRLVEAVQAAYPQASTPDEYYKELVRAIDARKAVERLGGNAAGEKLAEDADLGRKVREAATKAGSSDPYQFAENAVARAGAGKKGEWPPFFSLSEAGGYYFESGKATLRPDFERKLRTTIIPLLKRYIDEYGVDVVEVIGHTDEVPMVGDSNLDKFLIPASASRASIESLHSTDNAGLAMARAVAVVRILRADPRLAGFTILPLSGAQMIIPVDHVADGTATQSDQARRRIEMRLRRSTKQVAPTETR
jgi:outer membrane protein OmpA-like peptidoglycan-associated protein